MKSSRKLKVSAKFQRLRYKHKTVPEIRLTGEWLALAGFSVGDTVNISISENQLVISVQKNN